MDDKLLRQKTNSLSQMLAGYEFLKDWLWIFELLTGGKMQK